MHSHHLMEDLTAAQRDAVSSLDGPVLVLAGPGSGKTRVITRRIASLLSRGVPGSRILAITFTNKAAGEMAERVKALAPESRVWISTFHRFCARLLRRYGEVVGLQSNYSILDTSDQRQVIRLILRDLDIDPIHYSPDKLLWRIGQAKQELITPQQYLDRLNERIGDDLEAQVRRVYPAYQKHLLDSNAVDFDDLLMHAAVLLSENPELREQLDEQYRYVLVDEYQDTNRAQYLIASALAQVQRNLCVTGDPDQSIYGWRGARIDNILSFEKDFPDARVIRLEQNFRSTASILRCADTLISHNSLRKDKRLITDREDGCPVRLLTYNHSAEEGAGLAETIQELTRDGSFQYSDIAIFYRVNALSRTLEQALRQSRIPFQVAAGVAFFDRAEVKDLLAYLRLIENPADQAAFLRVVNTPLRGLGQTSRNRLLAWAASRGLSALEAASRAGDVPDLSKRAVTGFRTFAKLIQEFSLAETGSVAGLLERVIQKTGYLGESVDPHHEEAIQRRANVMELVSAAAQYDERAGDERSLQGFLEETALVNETDSLEDSSGRVTLMTLHAAKGLEFPVVFIMGLEDGLIPHKRARDDGRDLEEERRLLFVGITRAREHLFLTRSVSRLMHGATTLTIPSLFLYELEYESVDLTGNEEGHRADWEVDESADMPEEEDQEAAQFDESPHTEEASPESSRQSLTPRLMRGSALLTGETGSVAVPVGFAIGQQVRHPRYGRGTVVDVSGFGARRTAMVLFANDQEKRSFVINKSPLQPIGGTTAPG